MKQIEVFQRKSNHSSKRLTTINIIQQQTEETYNQYTELNEMEEKHRYGNGDQVELKTLVFTELVSLKVLV